MKAADGDGAGSGRVAGGKATGVRGGAGVDGGVATAGMARPDGGTPEKPVGTVYIGLAYRGEWGTGDSYTAVDRHVFDGDRVAIKEQIARCALETLLDAVEST